MLVQHLNMFSRIQADDLEYTAGFVAKGINRLLQNHGMAGEIPLAIDFFDKEYADWMKVVDAALRDGELVYAIEFDLCGKSCTSLQLQRVIDFDLTSHRYLLRRRQFEPAGTKETNQVEMTLITI